MNKLQLEHINADFKNRFPDLENFASLKNKTVFITGASGFIGQWLLLCFAFLNNKHAFNIKIIASSRSFEKNSVVDSINENGNFIFDEIDVRYSFDIPTDCEYIIHLAASPDRRVHASSPLDVIRTNIDGTENILRVATRLEKLKKVLVFTSGHTHGKLKRNTDMYAPGSCLNFSASYTESKRVAETLCHIYASHYQVPVGIVRPYSFIGPLQDLDRPWAINNFINGALLNQNIKVVGNPDTKKSFLYPTDMVHLILDYLISDNTEVPLELGSTEIVSLQEVAESIARQVDTGVCIEYSDKERKTGVHDFYPLKEEATSNMLFEECISRSLIWFKINNEQ